MFRFHTILIILSCLGLVFITINDAHSQSSAQTQVAIKGLKAEGLLSTLIAAYNKDPGSLANKSDIIIASYEVMKKMNVKIEEVRKIAATTPASSENTNNEELSAMIQNELATEEVQTFLKESLGITNLISSGVSTSDTTTSVTNIALQTEIETLQARIAELEQGTPTASGGINQEDLDELHLLIQQSIEETRIELKEKIEDVDEKVENRPTGSPPDSKKSTYVAVGVSVLVATVSAFAGAR